MDRLGTRTQVYRNANTDNNEYVLDMLHRTFAGRGLAAVRIGDVQKHASCSDSRIVSRDAENADSCKHDSSASVPHGGRERSSFEKHTSRNKTRICGECEKYSRSKKCFKRKNGKDAGASFG